MANCGRSVGAILFLLGYLTAGIMFIIIGVEYNKSATSNDNLRTFFWVYAIAMLLGTVGSILDNGQRFCGKTELKEVDYFGGIFQVVAGFAWAGFGAGIAFFYADSQLSDPNATDERENLAWLSGIAAIFYAFGSLFVLKALLCCEFENLKCLEMILNLGNMFLMILLVIFWFLFADALGKNPLNNAGDNNRRNYSIAIGVFYILQALEGVLMFMLACCCGDDDESSEPVEPVDPDQPSCFERIFCCCCAKEPVEPVDPGYGNEKPGYGENNGYGQGYNNGGNQGYNNGQTQY